MVFLCETKKRYAFIRTIYNKLKYQTRWITSELIGLSRGLLLCLSEETTVYQVITHNFCFEVEFESLTTNAKCWGIFSYLSPNLNLRKTHWYYLINSRDKWRRKWFLGGDLNDLKGAIEKQRGRVRSEDSFRHF